MYLLLYTYVFDEVLMFEYLQFQTLIFSTSDLRNKKHFPSLTQKPSFGLKAILKQISKDSYKIDYTHTSSMIVLLKLNCSTKL